MANIGSQRLETFSDGVLAIIITVMVLDFKMPHETDFTALLALWPIFLSYVLSFIYVGIYWNNHHHMILVTDHVSGKVLWANLFLLFWLSLIPFVTSWLGESHFTAVAPTVMYGVVLLMAAIAYWLLQSTILTQQKRSSLLARAIGKDLKGKLSPVLYASAIGIAFAYPPAALALYVAAAMLWLVPDRRIEERVEKAEAL